MQIQARGTRDTSTIRWGSLRGKAVASSVTAWPLFLRLLAAVFLGNPVLIVDLALVASAASFYYWTNGPLDAPAIVFSTVLAALLFAQHTRPRRLIPSVLDDAGDVCKRVLIALASAALIQLLIGAGPPPALGLTLVTAAALLVGRVVSYGVIRWARRRGSGARVLVVGTGVVASRVIAALRQHREYGLRVIGATGESPLGLEELGADVLGPNEVVPELVREHAIQAMIVAPLDEEEAGALEAVRSAMANHVAVWVVPKTVEFGMSRGKDHLWGVPVVQLQPLPTNRPEWLLKRTFDFVVGCLLLVLTAPLQALIAVCVYLDSGRPILLQQLRVGQDGRPFTIFKFRTMTNDGSTAIDREWQATESRITRVGHVLRASDLDELPQLFNVLKGDMSLVGPRPERPFFVSSFTTQFPQYDMRHRLPVGITGWAQIHGLRGDTSIEERVAFDNYYIETWSLAQDVRIVLRTLFDMMGKAIRISVAGRAR